MVASEHLEKFLFPGVLPGRRTGRDASSSSTAAPPGGAGARRRAAVGPGDATNRQAAVAARGKGRGAPPPMGISVPVAWPAAIRQHHLGGGATCNDVWDVTCGT